MNLKCMKNKNNKSKLLLILLCACLKANVVITEIFINSEDETKIPQYIELYNASSIELDLTNWSIETWLISTECNIG